MLGARGRVLKNAIALSSAQIAGYILPLVLLPYTAVVLGPAIFGALALIQAVVMQCAIVVNYGFPYSATRQVAFSKDDSHLLASLLVNVWGAKAILMVSCLLFSLLAFALFHPLRPYLSAYLCAFLSLTGTVFYPDWFFQGVEEMKWITISSVVPKLLILPLVFLFVKQPSDYWKLLLIQSMNAMVSGAMGIALVKRWLGHPLPVPRRGLIAAQLKSGFVTFLSCASTNFNSSFNTLILGGMAGSVAVGLYSAAQRVVTALQLLWTAVSQALYPFFCSRFQLNVQDAAAKLRRIVLSVGAVTLGGAVMASLAAPSLVAALFGDKYRGTIPVFQVLIFLVFASSVSSLLGLQGLLGMGLERDYLKVVGTGTLLNIVFSFMAIRLYGGVGLAASVILLEMVLAAREFHILRRREVF
jgi:O-antigen/teichoic acid export membrane protein